ncbi:hypothetical protein EVAR_31948_1 [Eumeta japonica]|uniref:Uncharacterized protein n=1 Tax=Eumeta variegata TaxID=151549 RepID=A0A4C1SXI2_EUMVA|nr:hypothetical protein EVAR_31948_1 [Eumeta japonica]
MVWEGGVGRKQKQTLSTATSVSRENAPSMGIESRRELDILHTKHDSEKRRDICNSDRPPSPPAGGRLAGGAVTSRVNGYRARKFASETEIRRPMGGPDSLIRVP